MISIKSMLLKTLLGLLVFLLGSSLLHMWEDSGVSSVVSNHLAVAQVNGGNQEFVAQKMWSHFNPAYHQIWFWLTIGLTALWIFCGKAANKTACCGSKMSIILLCLAPFFTSCMKPYQEPVYTEVKNNETAFVIPLEGDNGDQAKMNSKEFLEKHKVSTKRIEIPTRWNQTGRYSDDGEWIRTVKVIVVDRAPTTRNWDADKNKNAAIWVESADSVGFSMGFNCTAFIREEDTATFLYWYASGSLEVVMDSEIRGRVQQVAAEECAKFPLDELRNRKNEIAKAVREDVIPFFSVRGITVTTLGLYAGMTYENPAIQTSIDNVFVAQQEKNVALAKFDAQKKENERIVLASQGIAQQRQIESEAEAKAITALTKAVADGGSNYLALKALEVQLKQTEKWNGALPTFTGGSTPIISADKFLR